MSMEITCQHRSGTLLGISFPTFCIGKVFVWCRRDISSVSNPPIGTSFGPQNIPLPLQVKNPTIGMLFLIRITETHFPHSLETETQLCHKMHLIPMIPTVL